MSNSQKYPPNWTTQTLAEACDISIGGTPSRNQDSFWAQGEDGYPWVTISDMGPKLITKTNERITKAGVVNSNAKSVRVGTTLMSFKLTLGRMGIAGIDLYTNEAIAAFVPKSEDVNSKWLYHFLPGLVTSVTAEQAIKGQTLNKKKLNKLTIYLPSPNEQRRIAEILDTIDEAIQKTEVLISKLKAMKQGLLHDLLTRGLDKNGKLRDPKAHPEQFQDSPLGSIPKEWGINPLEKLAEVDRGKFTHRPRNDPRFYGGTYPFVQTGDIAEAEGDILKKYSQTLNNSGSVVSREFPENTIAITIAANIADTAILGQPMYFPDSIVGAIVRPPNNVRYIELCIRRAKRILNAHAPQSAQKNINLEDLRPLLIPTPTSEEQNRIGDMYDAHSNRVQSEEQYHDKLKLQKKGLMHDLLTGKVRAKSKNNLSCVKKYMIG